jgi:hypothetical protein
MFCQANLTNILINSVIEEILSAFKVLWSFLKPAVEKKALLS